MKPALFKKIISLLEKSNAAAMKASHYNQKAYELMADSQTEVKVVKKRKTKKKAQ